MPLQTTQMPYEFLARWGADGKLQGCHVQWRYIISDGTVTVAEGLSEAEAVTNATTYPLSDLLNQVQAGAIAAAGDAQEALVTAQNLVTKLRQQLQEQSNNDDSLAST